MNRNPSFIYFAPRLLAGLFLLCGLASANSIIVVADPRTPGSLGENIWIGAYDPSTQTVKDEPTFYSGVLSITLTDTDTGAQFVRDTLCVDLFTDIIVTQQYYTTVLNPYDVPGKNLPRVAWLVDNALRPTNYSQAPFNFSLLPEADWVTTPAQGAGIQLAIWDIVHDGGDGFTSGNVQEGSAANPTDPAALAWAQYYEDVSVGGDSNRAFVYNNVDMGNGAIAQMLAGPQFFDHGPIPDPEPSTFGLAAAALLMAGTFLRSRYLAR